ncbi:MAG: glycosyltransferase family 1 protein [Candidatus Spechtbacterales bacterium]
MKIGVDIRSLIATPYGGVVEYGKNLLPALLAVADEHEFILFANSFNNTPLPEWLLPYEERVRMFHYPNKFFSLTTRVGGFPKLDKLIGGADVWFSPHMLPAPVSPSVPRVTTFHDISFERFPYFFDARRRMWHGFMNPRAQAQASARVIVPSDATRQDVVAFYGVPPAHVKVIYPGVPSHPSPTREDRLENFPYILSLCTLEPRKNLVSVIAAFGRVAHLPVLANHHLILAGPAGWSWRGIERAAAASPYREKIHILGSVSPSRAAALYEGASLFVYPSFYEGFGFPPLEAMAHGVPVIASMTSSLPEVVGEAGVLVDPHRVETLGALLVEIMGDTSLRKELSRKGREQASQFSWEKAARQTQAVLEEAFFHRER